MLKVAQQVIIEDFPRSLLSSEEKPLQPRTVLNAVSALSRFYSETISYERSLRSVMPSDGLKKLHQTMFSWSDPIRDAVHQVFKYVQELIDCEPHSTINFTVTFGGLPHMEEFKTEMARAQANLSQLQREW